MVQNPISHLESMQGENAKVVLHEREVTLWEVRCYYCVVVNYSEFNSFSSEC